VSETNEIATSQEFVSKELYDSSLLEIELLKQQLAELRRLIFGSKSERFVAHPDGQLGLFADMKEEAKIPEQQQVSYTREKKQGKEKPVRSVLPAHLPRVEEIIEPKELPEGSKKIGEEITEQLEYNPAQVYVRRIVRPKYALPKDQGVIIAELPTLTLPKTNAGASILAHIAVSKFVDHLPLYRQRQIFKRQQLHISDSTIGDWLAATCDLLRPLYDCLSRKVLQSSYLQMDESPIGVQDKHTGKGLHTGYQWVMHAPIERLVLFHYDPSRSKRLPEKLPDLSKFRHQKSTCTLGVHGSRTPIF
jgi:transposase